VRTLCRTGPVQKRRIGAVFRSADPFQTRPMDWNLARMRGRRQHRRAFVIHEGGGSIPRGRARASLHGLPVSCGGCLPPQTEIAGKALRITRVAQKDHAKVKVCEKSWMTFRMTILTHMFSWHTTRHVGRDIIPAARFTKIRFEGKDRPPGDYGAGARRTVVQFERAVPGSGS